MKLIVAIVQDEDTHNLIGGLIQDGFRVTRIASTGSFLGQGNSSLLIGVDDRQVPSVMAIIDRYCHRRMQTVIPDAPEAGLPYLPQPFDVEVGGAVIFVLNVVRFERV